MTSHPSDSVAQRAAEPLIVAAVAEKLGVGLQPTVIVRDGATVQIDGASSDLRVLVEAYAHVGPLRGAQPKKLATDAFKLAWIGPKVGAQALIIAVLDDDAASYLARPKAWLTAALRDAGIIVTRVDVTPATREMVLRAQAEQWPPGRVVSTPPTVSRYDDGLGH